MVNRFIFQNLVIASTIIIAACGSNAEDVVPSDTVIIDMPDIDKTTDPDQTTDLDDSVTSKTAVTSWVVSAEAAKIHLGKNGGMILDTRPSSEFSADNIQGSENVNWQTFSMTEEAERGELLALDEIGKHLDGLTKKQWVFIVGNPSEGWGEDGRIVWMLQALGHTNAALIDGGFAAAKTAGISGPAPKEEPSTVPTTMGTKPKGYQPSVSAFAFSATADDVKAAIDSDIQIIDVREKREFDGETPYGETRGGHVPTAKHLHYKSLLDAQGNLLSRKQIREVLIKAGIDPTKPSIAYCTGGVRSAWLTAVLVAIDIDATNYAGSMWQWASYPAADYPLE